MISVLGVAGTFTRETAPRLKELWCIAVGDPCIGRHELQIIRDGTAIELNGGITFGLTDEIERLLKTAPGVHAIILNSPGGRVKEAKNLQKLIGERGLVTYVRSDCASACTIAFMGGVRRYIGQGARLGFHRSTLDGATSQQTDEENDDDRRALIAAGAAAWFANRAYSTPSNSMWWPSVDELSAANVITPLPTVAATAPEPLVTHAKGPRAPAPPPKREGRNFGPPSDENPPSSSLCPPTYRMTARDGCQK